MRAGWAPGARGPGSWGNLGVQMGQGVRVGPGSRGAAQTPGPPEEPACSPVFRLLTKFKGKPTKRVETCYRGPETLPPGSGLLPRAPLCLAQQHQDSGTRW